MMLISIAVSTGLVFAGLALLDMCVFGDFGSPAIVGIAVVVVAFAGLLTAVVINTLTTINISEREREIATLMVLGYHDGEICGYIYREICISAFLAFYLAIRGDRTCHACIQNDRVWSGRRCQLVYMDTDSVYRFWVYFACNAYA